MHFFSMRRPRFWMAAVLATGIACSSQRAPNAPGAEPTTPDEPVPSETTTEPAAAEMDPSGPEEPRVASEPASGTIPGVVDLDAQDGLDADMAALAQETSSARPADAAKQESEAPREIVYRVTPQGLVIELDGLHLRPEAKPFKDKNGAYGIEIVLHAESFDGRQYWLKKPTEGPLSLAGNIQDKAGKANRFADERRGDGEDVIMAGQPRRFRQRWPGRGQPKLWWGQTVTLEAGLWGMRADSERERPVRRLFVIKMVGGNPPQPVVTPPTLDWGS